MGLIQGSAEFEKKSEGAGGSKPNSILTERNLNRFIEGIQRNLYQKVTSIY